MTNEMKPGWEQTLMAEDIFKKAVAYFCARNPIAIKGSKDDTWERFADAAMDASTVFRRCQKERNFPDLATIGIPKDG